MKPQTRTIYGFFAAMLLLFAAGLGCKSDLFKSRRTSAGPNIPTSSQEASSFPSQVGSYRLQKTVSQEEVKRTSTGPSLAIMNAANRTDAATYTASGGKEVIWIVSLFTSADRAQTAEQNAVSALRSNRRFRIVYDTPASTMFAANEGAFAISTSENSVQQFAGNDPESVRAFISAAAQR